MNVIMAEEERRFTLTLSSFSSEVFQTRNFTVEWPSQLSSLRVQLLPTFQYILCGRQGWLAGRHKNVGCYTGSHALFVCVVLTLALSRL